MKTFSSVTTSFSVRLPRVLHWVLWWWLYGGCASPCDWLFCSLIPLPRTSVEELPSSVHLTKGCLSGNSRCPVLLTFLHSSFWQFSAFIQAQELEGLCALYLFRLGWPESIFYFTIIILSQKIIPYILYLYILQFPIYFLPTYPSGDIIHN